MASSKKKRQPISPYFSADPQGWERRFIQIGNSFLLHSSFKALSGNEKHLYLCLGVEAGGKPEVVFTHSTARKYGISSTTFDRCIKKLISSGFIERVYSSDRQFDPAKYRFSPRWKS